jgi:hypothetical protein
VQAQHMVRQHLGRHRPHCKIPHHHTGNCHCSQAAL